MVNSGVSQGELLKSNLTMQGNKNQFRGLHPLRFLAVKFQQNLDVGTFAQGPLFKKVGDSRKHAGFLFFYVRPITF